jgi:phage shock protein A
MNFFIRIWQVIKANVNALIDRVEDPQKVLEQSIRDMYKQVQRVRTDVVTVVAEEKKLKSQIDKYQQEIERWERNAMLALKEGKEELAREALRRKKESVEYVQQLRPQWEKQAAIAERLKAEYYQLRNRIETAQRKKQNLIFRLRHAETQNRLQNMLTELKTDRVFERLEGKIAETEALTDAKMELEESSLEHQFEQLTSSNLDVEQELAALKERMQLNP